MSAAHFISTFRAQVEAYAAEKKLSIVGYYHANERLDDKELGAVAKKIADKIQSYCPSACVLLVSARRAVCAQNLCGARTAARRCKPVPEACASSSSLLQVDNAKIGTVESSKPELAVQVCARATGCLSSASGFGVAASTAWFA